MTALALPGPVLPALRSVQRAVLRHRKLLAAGLVAAAAAALDTVAPARPPSAAVLTAARDLDAGARLGGGDVTLRSVPAAALPAGVLRSADAAVGRVLAGAVRRGEPLTDVRLVGRALLASVRPGHVAAFVRVSDASAAHLLQPGDLVDVVAAPPAAADRFSVPHLVAAAVRVLAVAPAGEGAQESEGGLVLLDVDTATGADLAAAAVSARISVLLHPD